MRHFKTRKESQCVREVKGLLLAPHPLQIITNKRTLHEANIQRIYQSPSNCQHLALAGCAELDQAAKSVQTATARAVVKDTLPQICQAAKDNRVRANDFYANKELSVSGEVRSINEGIQPHYRVYMMAGKISVHAGTENQLAVKQLTVGKTATVVGTITEVSYDYQGCSIALKDAAF